MADFVAGLRVLRAEHGDPGFQSMARNIPHVRGVAGSKNTFNQMVRGLDAPPDPPALRGFVLSLGATEAEADEWDARRRALVRALAAPDVVDVAGAVDVAEAGAVTPVTVVDVTDAALAAVGERAVVAAGATDGGPGPGPGPSGPRAADPARLVEPAPPVPVAPSETADPDAFAPGHASDDPVTAGEAHVGARRRQRLVVAAVLTLVVVGAGAAVVDAMGVLADDGPPVATFTSPVVTTGMTTVVRGTVTDLPAGDDLWLDVQGPGEKGHQPTEEPCQVVGMAFSFDTVYVGTPSDLGRTFTITALDVRRGGPAEQALLVYAHRDKRDSATAYLPLPTLPAGARAVGSVSVIRA